VKNTQACIAFEAGRVRTGSTTAIEISCQIGPSGTPQLLKAGKLTCASATAFSLSPRMLTEVNANMASHRERIVLRPQEISNNPGIIRRLGVIAMKGMIEADYLSRAERLPFGKHTPRLVTESLDWHDLHLHTGNMRSREEN
jgi:acyl-CoA hydrolase